VNELRPNREHIAENLAQSLMLVTARNPRIGYEKAVRIGRLGPGGGHHLETGGGTIRLRSA